MWWKVFADGSEYDIIYAVSKADAIKQAHAKHGNAVWTACVYG